MAKYIDNTNLGYLISKIKAAFWPKADVTNVTLADVAVTGDYDDLKNKPTIPAPEIFWATYGTTTVAEIDAAVAAGKAVMVRKNGITYILTKGIGTRVFTAIAGTINNYYLTLNSEDNTWANGSVTFEQTYNKATSWGNVPSNNKYPSEKLVKDYVDGLVGDIETLLAAI